MLRRDNLRSSSRRFFIRFIAVVSVRLVSVNIHSVLRAYRRMFKVLNLRLQVFTAACSRSQAPLLLPWISLLLDTRSQAPLLLPWIFLLLDRIVLSLLLSRAPPLGLEFCDELEVGDFWDIGEAMHPEGCRGGAELFILICCSSIYVLG